MKQVIQNTVKIEKGDDFLLSSTPLNMDAVLYELG